MGVNVNIIVGDSVANSKVSASGLELIQPDYSLAKDFGLPNIQERGSGKRAGVCAIRYSAAPRIGGS